jgi:fatty-acyl-CoA synthase
MASSAVVDSFAGALEGAARFTPAATAIQFVTADGDGVAITWGELVRRSLGIAAGLGRRGIRAGDVVFIVLPTGVPLVETFVAVGLAGAIPAILPGPSPKVDPAVYRQRLRGVTEYSRPALIVTDPDLQAAMSSELQRTATVTPVTTHAELASGSTAGLEGFATLPASALPGLLQYSSGTTGLQKGVLLSQDALLRQVESYARAIRLTTSDVVVSWLPLYHDMGLIAAFLMPLLTHTKVVLMSPLDWVRRPAMLLEAVSRHRATLTWLPNFAFNFLASKVRDRELDAVRLDSLRAVINCSEPMSADSHDRFVQRFAPLGLRADAIATCYAMAENTFAVTQGGIDAAVRLDPVDRAALATERRAVRASGGASKVMVSAGRPIDGAEVRIVAADGQTLGQRMVGEIAIRSGSMLTGYYRRPDLTAAAFQHGWFLTGDLGYLADGELFVSGRKKDLLIIGGQNFFPQDIEAVVDTVDGVHPGRCAAFGLFDDAAGTEALAVVAEVEEEAAPRRDQIRDAIRARVARETDAVASIVHLVEPGWLVKTSSGKVARVANREKYCRERGLDLVR